MKTRTVTVNEGEWTTDGTPDEWFAAHAVTMRDQGARCLMTDAQREMVRQLTTAPPEGKFWLVRTSGYWHKMWCVGLYDGWVWWAPRVAVGTDGPISGMHTHEGYDIEAVALGEYDPERKVFPFNGWRMVG